MPFLPPNQQRQSTEGLVPTSKSKKGSPYSMDRGTIGVNSLPKTVTRQSRDCDLNPGHSAPESSTLTSRLPSRPIMYQNAIVDTSGNRSRTPSAPSDTQGMTSCSDLRSRWNVRQVISSQSQLIMIHSNKNNDEVSYEPLLQHTTLSVTCQNVACRRTHLKFNENHIEKTATTRI